MLDNLLFVVKVGTNVLTDDQGLLEERILEHLVGQIAEIHKEGYQVVFVSSGAVGAGLSLIQPKTRNRVESRQVLASVGQPILIEKYRQKFAGYDLAVGQVLATKDDFRDRHHYLNMRNCITALLKEGVVPIINENDVTAIEELMFTDNDDLAGLVASMMGANKLVILTSVDGLMDRDPKDPNAQLIPDVNPVADGRTPHFIGKGSAMGRGGMGSKYRVSCKVAMMGIEVEIANGRKENVLVNIAHGKQMGTVFHRREKISPLKKWIAYQENGQQPTIIVNQGAAAALTSIRATSLLPIGVVVIEGDFQKGDIAIIKDEQGVQIGVGLTQYSSKVANNYLGQRGYRPLIHYDYLFITSEIN